MKGNRIDTSKIKTRYREKLERAIYPMGKNAQSAARLLFDSTFDANVSEYQIKKIAKENAKTVVFVAISEAIKESDAKLTLSEALTRTNLHYTLN